MKSNKLFLLLFLTGLICITFAGLNIFLGLKPSLPKSHVQYEIGSILSIKGSIKKSLSSFKKKSVKEGQKIYSKERFLIDSDSIVSFKLSNETISISGPADISLGVISPETKKIFINFAHFTEVSPKTAFKNLILTYKGWIIEPYFNKNDLKTSTSQNINMPAVSKDNDSNKIFDKKSLLDELIGSKRSLLKKCYENYLRKNPMATGKLVVEFVLQNTGKVSSSKIKDSSFFKDESFKNCIQNIFKRIKTSPFDGDSILVTYPIEFE